jgi:hypothetical protein
VPEQELDLLQLATTLVAEPSGRATEVMGGHVAEIARIPTGKLSGYGDTREGGVWKAMLNVAAGAAI